jgi:hypothetical protein
MTIELCIQNRGLGSQLTLLSFLNSTEEQYVIRCPYDAFRQLTSLKNIFSLQRDNIQIVEDNSVTDFNVFSDFAKFFCGYLSPNGLNLFGQTLYKKEHKKPCIGVACYTHTIKPFNKFELENSIEKTSFPYNKWSYQTSRI